MAVEVVNCINKGLPVCFSYAPNSDEKPEWEHIADCVDTLKQLFDAKNIEYLIDDTPESDTEIPEPAAFAYAAMGLASAFGLKRRIKK